MEPFDIFGNKTEFLFKLILNTIKEMVYFDKVNVMKTFFLEMDHLLTCNLGIYLQDKQLCSEFIEKFFTDVALQNP